MTTKAPFWTKSYLFVQFHSGSGTPYAIRINCKKLLGLVSLVSILCFGLLVGTLLFFRELELNRKLQEQVLVFETQEKLAEYLKTNSRTVAANPDPTTQTAQSKETANSLEEENASPAVASNVTEAKSGDSKTEKPPTPVVSAKIADLNPQCSEETCNVKLTMVPNASGLAQGQLLILLETEIPRIGIGNPSSNVRKRYFIYPGYQSIDDIDQNKIHQLARKNYHFSRALVTTAEFSIGKLLRPLAVNVYLFDKAGTNIHHERKIIESGE